MVSGVKSSVRSREILMLKQMIAITSGMNGMMFIIHQTLLSDVLEVFPHVI